jgi:hypothetical protein
VPIFHDGDGTCQGEEIGVVVQLRAGPQVISLIVIVTGNPDETRQLYYVSSADGDCHEGCGFVNLGTITTSSSGFGSAFLEFRNPFPGEPMHWDISPVEVTPDSKCDPTQSGATSNYFSGPFTGGVGNPMAADRR